MSNYVEINAIGLIKIREQCPVFNHWLTKIEGLKGNIK
jgi:hypothetical protein